MNRGENLYVNLICWTIETNYFLHLEASLGVDMFMHNQSFIVLKMMTLFDELFNWSLYK